MINEEELYSVLINRVPGIETEIKDMADSICPYKLAAFFAVYTKKLLAARNYPEVKKCFRVAEDLIINGSFDVKNAIENVYVFSVSNTIGPGHVLYVEFPDLLKRSINDTLLS